MTRLACACALLLRGLASAQPAAPPADGLSDADRALLEASEVIAIEQKSDAQVLRESARAVTVIDTAAARERTADLGEVLSRAPGIQVRRAGGLGAQMRFSLNGLYDEQVRFFLDGIPLQLAGWGIGVASIPIELVQRVDVHRGVVPIALGADALGGAVELQSDPSWVPRAVASLELASFGTVRSALITRTRDARTGLVAGLSGFADRALNNYPIDVRVADATGRLRTARVPRFHDGYLAAGGTAELGVVERGALRRAVLRAYANRYSKDLQHNLIMSVPYGEAGYGEDTRGTTADVLVEHGAWRLRVLGGGARRAIGFHDLATAVYDWFGRAGRTRPVAGETGGSPTLQVVRETGLFARVTGERALGDHQRLRVAVAPTASLRGGDDLLDAAPRDRLSARRDLVQLVTGVEHEASYDGVDHIGFVKHYAMWTEAEEARAGNAFAPVSQRRQRLGIGDALRWRVRDGLAVKASYEWATRLPSVDEIFGDGRLVDANLALAPETSHNANVEAQLATRGRFGELAAQLDGFARLADRLIVLTGSDRRFLYANVTTARILGIEGSGTWSAPGGWARVAGSFTYQDLRNTSDTGLLAAYRGDRIPNRPWLLAALGGSVRTRGLLRDGDELTGFVDSRYVHAFYRGWESLGNPGSKQVIPGQLHHSAGVTYALRGARVYSATFEVDNLTDAAVYDAYGIVRPGRALALKLSVEI